MEFTNQNIELSTLPEVEDSDFHGLEKDYLYMRLTAWGIFFFISGLVFSIWSLLGSFTWWQWLAPWAALLAFILFVEIKGFSIKGYSIREKDISYKSGLIFFSMTSIPFNRIQHCEVGQGPLGRAFDLAAVKVYTAGGSSSDIIIRGLQEERAQKLRDYITKLSADYE